MLVRLHRLAPWNPLQHLVEVRTAEGKLYLFVAIDRTSKFAVVELVEKADMRTAPTFLEALIAAVPYRIHTVLIDNGIQFADLPNHQGGYRRTCHVQGIEHRLTKPNHPWTSGQVERMNRRIARGQLPASAAIPSIKRFFIRHPRTTQSALVRLHRSLQLRQTKPVIALEQAPISGEKRNG
jgi:transposase InsO family protein